METQQSSNAIDDAIEFLTSENARSEIAKRIQELEQELANLKRLYKAVGGSLRSASSKVNEQLEKEIVSLLEEHGPLPPKDIGIMLDVHFMKIGKTVKASRKLDKSGASVVLA